MRPQRLPSQQTLVSKCCHDARKRTKKKKEPTLETFSPAEQLNAGLFWSTTSEIHPSPLAGPDVAFDKTTERFLFLILFIYFLLFFSLSLVVIYRPRVMSPC